MLSLLETFTQFGPRSAFALARSRRHRESGRIPGRACYALCRDYSPLAGRSSRVNTHALRLLLLRGMSILQPLPAARCRSAAASAVFLRWKLPVREINSKTPASWAPSLRWPMGRMRSTSSSQLWPTAIRGSASDRRLTDCAAERSAAASDRLRALGCEHRAAGTGLRAQGCEHWGVPGSRKRSGERIARDISRRCRRRADR